jgi:bile acid:Na+ symporter, BASS family
MLSVGFQLTSQDILKTIHKSGLIASSLFINFLIIPIVALVLIWCLALPEATSITLLLASAAPGAPFAPKLVAIADGDLASAIGLTFLLSILAVAVTPLIAYLAPSSGNEVLVNILPIIWSLVFLQLLPLLAGVAIRHQSVLFATRLLHPVKLLSDITFVALLVLVMNKNFDRLTSISYSSLMAMTLFVIVTLVCSWKLSGSETRIRKALALTTAARNVAIMLVVAVEFFPKTGVEVAVIAFGLVELMLTLLAAVYFRHS